MAHSAIRMTVSATRFPSSARRLQRLPPVRRIPASFIGASCRSFSGVMILAYRVFSLRCKRAQRKNRGSRGREPPAGRRIDEAESSGITGEGVQTDMQLTNENEAYAALLYHHLYGRAG